MNKKCGSTHVFMIRIENAAYKYTSTHTHTHAHAHAHIIYKYFYLQQQVLPNLYFLFPFTDRLKSLLA